MEDSHIKILLIEDDPDYPILIETMLATVSYNLLFELENADLLQSGLKRLTAGGIDIVLLDLSLPDSRGLDTFTRVNVYAPKVPIVVLSCLDDEELAIEAVREGAQDYLVKDRVDGNLLAQSIRYAIERHRMLEELKQKTRELEASEAKNRAILSAIPDLMFQINKDGIFMDYKAAKNGDVAQLSLRDNFSGKKVHEVLPAEISQEIMRQVGRALQTDETRIFEYQLPLNSDTRDYEARIVACGKDEALAIVRDITERKEIERMRNELLWRLRRSGLR